MLCFEVKQSVFINKIAQNPEKVHFFYKKCSLGTCFHFVVVVVVVVVVVDVVTVVVTVVPWNLLSLFTLVVIVVSVVVVVVVTPDVNMRFISVHMKPLHCCSQYRNCTNLDIPFQLPLCNSI